RGQGTVGTILIQRGTLRTGDVFVAGEAWGKVRALINHTGARVTEAGPSVPIQARCHCYPPWRFDGIPDAGEAFLVVDKEETARELAEARRKISRASSAAN
ncbi:unnamed protein product, partial [Discosporangium mesarthrocarpum]